MGDLISRAALFNALANCHDKGEIFAKIQEAAAVDAVVLPCKVGDTLWRVFHGSIEKYAVSNVMYRGLKGKWQIDCMPYLADAYDDLGKTVFLTREEAEAEPCLVHADVPEGGPGDRAG